MDAPKILIVEDEIITALDIKSRLQRAGYAVPAIASSGEGALSELAAARPDLVLMDIHLKGGGMDGIEAAGIIRQQFAVPVVYLTAYADPETLARAKATEPHGYLLKPFEENEIRTTIEMALYRHQMEARLRESERWLSTTLRSIGDAVIATDAQGRIRFMNPVAEALTGWTADDAMGLDITEMLIIVHEDTDAAVPNPIMQAIAENAVVELADRSVLIARDGTRLPIDDSAAPMRDDAGRVVGAVLVFRDITERRRAEEALRRYAADLEARNSELDAFAHTVAHDLKDPLNLIVGFSEFLASDHSTLSDEEMTKYLRIVTRAGRRMNNIIDELLLLSEARKHEVEPEPVDMRSVVAAAQLRLEHLIEERGAEIVRPAAWPSAMGHAPWIEEVWVNYLSNALKYGGEPPRVELGAEENGSTVRFWVRDNGPGIPPEDQARLFTPFTRLEHIRARGHGLGLSVVRRIMDKLGGRVGVESSGAPGQGSIFYFVLPRAEV